MCTVKRNRVLCFVILALKATTQTKNHQNSHFFKIPESQQVKMQLLLVNWEAGTLPLLVVISNSYGVHVINVYLIFIIFIITII